MHLPVVSWPGQLAAYWYSFTTWRLLPLSTSSLLWVIPIASCWQMDIQKSQVTVMDNGHTAQVKHLINWCNKSKVGVGNVCMLKLCLFLLSRYLSSYFSVWLIFATFNLHFCHNSGIVYIRKSENAQKIVWRVVEERSGRWRCSILHS